MSEKGGDRPRLLVAQGLPCLSSGTLNIHLRPVPAKPSTSFVSPGGVWRDCSDMQAESPSEKGAVSGIWPPTSVGLFDEEL